MGAFKTKQYDALIVAAGRKWGIPANILKGLIDVESSGNINARSPVGAFGLTQFMPGTARSYGVKPGDPRSQIYGAAKYLHDLGYAKNPQFALGAYNGGPGNPQYSYARNVVTASQRYKGVTKNAGNLDAALGATGGGKLTLEQPGTPESTNHKQALIDALLQGGAGKGGTLLSRWRGLEASGKYTTPAGSPTTTQVDDPNAPAGEGAAPAASGPPGAGKLTLTGAAYIAQHKFGLHVGENPHYGGVSPTAHVKNSYHYRGGGRALDISGDPKAMQAYANYMANNYGQSLTELFWRGSGSRNIKYGKPVGRNFVSGHQDHVHIAI